MHECQPLFTVPLPNQGVGSVAIADGMAYVEVGHAGPAGGPSELVAADATGTTGCGGVPKVCGPRWTAPLTGTAWYNTPAVAGGRVFAVSLANAEFGVVDAFDATGSTGCSGTPVVCTPIMTALDTGATDMEVSATVANGVIYLGGRAYDAGGVRGCIKPGSGQPTCGPLWSTPSGLAADTTIVDGLVLVGGADGFIHVSVLP